MNIKLEIIRYLENDTIATSGHYSILGMSSVPYELNIDWDSAEACGWELNTVTPDIHGSGSSFSYYDENGILKNESLTSWVSPGTPFNSDLPSGKWFHYKEVSPGVYTFVLCNNPTQHN